MMNFVNGTLDIVHRLDIQCWQMARSNVNNRILSYVCVFASIHASLALGSRPGTDGDESG